MSWSGIFGNTASRPSSYPITSASITSRYEQTLKGDFLPPLAAAHILKDVSDQMTTTRIEHYRVVPLGSGTPLEKRTQVWFELQEEISFAHDFLMKMLPENVQIKKIYRGTYTTDV